MKGSSRKAGSRKGTGKRIAKKRKLPVKPVKRRSLLGRLFLFLFPFLLAYLLWLDGMVRDQFEGKRWELPARVYASPMELYAGKPLTATQLVASLSELSYQRQSDLLETGSYDLQHGKVLLHSRPFRFWDGLETAQRVRISFQGGQIASIREVRHGGAVDLLRLDPLPIGSFYPAHGEDRLLVQLEALPEHLTKTLITVEDRAFTRHFGINPLGIGRALLANLKAGRMVQGGSTLTQQLAKNLFLNRERTLLRKVQEALITLLLEFHYSKREILEAYLNEVYFGQDRRRAIHGVGGASHFFFGHSASELTLPESALLVGMLKGPSRYNPRKHPKRAKARRNLVLDLLAQQGVVSESEAEQAKRAPLGVTRKAPSARSRYPAFLDLVRKQILRDYEKEDLVSEGLQIFTTLQPQVQRSAERALQQRIRELQRDGKSGLQGAVVAIHPGSGEVEALVGDKSPRSRGFNRALHAVRPIGSLVKPALFLAALEQPDRYTLISSLKDQPFELGSGAQRWRPENYDGKSHGMVPLYRALSHSYNLSTARLGVALGIPQVASTLRRLGVEREIPNYPSLFLGALELSPLEVTALYQPLANGGLQTPLRSIRAVMDRQGNPLNRYPLHVKEVASPDAVSLLQWGLQEVVRSGTGRALQQQLPSTTEIAGKTGTTDGWRDSWFAGFGGDRLAVVWMGRDDNSEAGVSGSTGALRVWGKMMAEAPIAPLQWRAPEGVQSYWINEAGQRTTTRCAGGERVPFIEGSAPRATVQCR